MVTFPPAEATRMPLVAVTGAKVRVLAAPPVPEAIDTVATVAGWLLNWRLSMANAASRVVAIFVAVTELALKMTVSAPTGMAVELVPPSAVVEKFESGPAFRVLHEPVT